LASSMVQPAVSEQQQQQQAEPQPTADLLEQARSVGREFVFIYYTCVNKCPQDLYRFYSTGSHFVHGGRELPGHAVEPPAVGQADIAARVKQLGLADCRTKILMVDSLPAPASGVLIQVCGEMSNNAGPMRRFMQTFLLSPIGPKKFYVLNDIFRYQDEVFTDSDNPADAPTDVKGSVSNGTAAVAEASEAAAVVAAAAAPPPPPPMADVAEANGISCPMVAASEERIDQGDQPAGDAADGNAAEIDMQQVEAAAEEPEAEEPAAPPAEDAAAAEEAPSCVPKESQPAAPGAKRNFAALFSSAGGASNGQPQPVQPQAPAPRRQAAAAPPPAQQQKQNGGSGAGGTPADEQRRQDRDAPDHLQVFVGNLAPDVRESDLAEAFRQCGEVASCRISAGKPRPGQSAATANFGFVTFASAAGVKAAVENPPNVKGGRVNVEMKKPGSGFRRGGGGGGSRGGGGGGHRGGFRSGGGGYGGPYQGR
uniref:NTF2 domain-containing protein n=1 Tax=Macrostomum lignano TaxID=282301 RepID=A0A1I8GJX3_9PLAT